MASPNVPMSPDIHNHSSMRDITRQIRVCQYIYLDLMGLLVLRDFSNDLGKSPKKEFTLAYMPCWRNLVTEPV
jgi:hypothetical protein